MVLVTRKADSDNLEKTRKHVESLVRNRKRDLIIGILASGFLGFLLGKFL